MMTENQKDRTKRKRTALWMLVIVGWMMSTQLLVLNYLDSMLAAREDNIVGSQGIPSRVLFLKDTLHLQIDNLTREQCDAPNEHKRTLDLVTIADPLPTERKPRVLCYILTVDTFHDTKVKAVIETWAPKCTAFFVASNRTDPSIGAVEIPNTRHSWKYLWEKHRETLRYFNEHNMVDDYDWFFKADDDTYVAFDNLNKLLTREDIKEQYPKRPLQLGYHGFKVTNPLWVIPPYLKELFVENSKSRYPEDNMLWLFAYGGAGFAMNKIFMKNVLAILDTRLCMNEEIKLKMQEDAALAMCQTYFEGGVPYNTTDEFGRELFLPNNPAMAWKNIGGKNCCSPNAVSFHHVDPDLMRYIHKQFTVCRGRM